MKRCGSILALLFFTCITHATSAHAEEGFVPIFDGKTLEGWKAPDMSYWSVQEGAITARITPEHPCKTNQYLVWRQGELDDFELKLSFRMVSGNKVNGGFQFRSRVLPDGDVAGYQVDNDTGGDWLVRLYDEHGRHTLAWRGQKTHFTHDGKKSHSTIEGATGKPSFSLGEWHEYHLTARGSHLALKVNGRIMAEVIDEDPAQRDLSGVLALQLHSGPPMTVQFKEIALKRLPLEGGRKKVVFLAGRPSHRPLEHEHNAGCWLLARCLNDNVPDRVLATVYHNNGWPSDPTAFDNADAVVMYCDGGRDHMVNRKLRQVDALARKGVGIGCIHYGVEVPKGESGDRMLDWTGGYFEAHWSVNPHWTAEFDKLPVHPITRGVKPFKLRDEWYYHMRFRRDMEGVTPILTDLPPKQTLNRPDGAHSGNPHVREAIERGEPQHVMWAIERTAAGGGGRGFGFTGGHFHKNWGDDDFRKTVLNAIVWIAGAKVPEEGVSSKVTPEMMRQKLDHKGRRR